MFSQGTAAWKQQHSNGLEGGERESSWERNGLHLISSMLMAGKELNPLARLQSWKDMWSTFEKHTHAALATCAAR